MVKPVVPPHMPPPRLLLVDDDVVLRDTLSPVLQNEGFKVTTAASGEEAERLLALAKPPFELVLTDLVMPGKSGMDVLRSALKADPSCTVLVLTGFGSVREASDAMDEGAYGLVTKPLQMDHFRNTLRRLFERSLIIHERDHLRAQVAKLHHRVEELEGVIGRMEMLAKEIAPRPSSGPVSEGLEDLQRLAAFKDRGLLTEEQFEASKKALLSRWTT